MKIDLSKDGLESIFTPWEITALEILTEGREYSSGTLVATVNNSGRKISQASIINFLEELTAYGITSKYVTTGKGGERGVYSTGHNMQTLREYIASLAENWAKEMRK